MDVHINDISVTEKEGAAALVGMSSPLYQMLQFGYNQASSLPNAKLHALARGEKSRCQEYTRPLR